MTPLPSTEDSLVLRTDYSDGDAGAPPALCTNSQC